MVRRVELDASEEKIFKRDLVGLIPHLRAFARTLCGDAGAARRPGVRKRAVGFRRYS